MCWCLVSSAQAQNVRVMIWIILLAVLHSLLPHLADETKNGIGKSSLPLCNNSESVMPRNPEKLKEIPITAHWRVKERVYNYAFKHLTTEVVERKQKFPSPGYPDVLHFPQIVMELLASMVTYANGPGRKGAQGSTGRKCDALAAELLNETQAEIHHECQCSLKPWTKLCSLGCYGLEKCDHHQ